MEKVREFRKVGGGERGRKREKKKGEELSGIQIVDGIPACSKS